MTPSSGTGIDHGVDTWAYSGDDWEVNVGDDDVEGPQVDPETLLADLEP